MLSVAESKKSRKPEWYLPEIAETLTEILAVLNEMNKNQQEEV